jgi:transcriptional regulator with XRE-family HTH domain
MRARAGLSGKDFASTLGWDQSKVSRIETGKQKPAEADIEAWARACDADEDTVRELLNLLSDARVANVAFSKRMRRGQASVQKDYAELAARSHQIRHFETAYIPGPLQIPAYARRVITEMIGLHHLEIDDVDAAVEERMVRAQMLYDPTKQWEFLIAEPVLRWLLPEAPVMREQLDRLQTVIGLERVRFGIIPMGVQLATTPQNTVEIYYTDMEIVAVTETYIGETWHRDEDAGKYARAIDLQWEDAVEGNAARELIVRARDRLL